MWPLPGAGGLVRRHREAKAGAGQLLQGQGSAQAAAWLDTSRVWVPCTGEEPARAGGGRMEGARGCARCRRGAGVRAHPLLLTARLTNSDWLTAGYSRDLKAQTETRGSSPEPNATPAWPRPPLPPSLPSHSADSPDLLRGRSTPTRGLSSIKPGDFLCVPSKARV